jgi:hypothetical protein
LSEVGRDGMSITFRRDPRIDAWCWWLEMSVMARIMAMLFAASVLCGTSSAFAAAGKHRPTHWIAARHALARTHAHAHARPFGTPYDPYAYGAYGAQPGSSAQERWFDQAKGNIW